MIVKIINMITNRATKTWIRAWTKYARDHSRKIDYIKLENKIIKRLNDENDDDFIEVCGGIALGFGLLFILEIILG